MFETFQNYYSYWFCFLLLTIGLYGMLLKRNLVKKVIGLSIFQAAIILFFILLAYKNGATVPVIEGKGGPGQPDDYINPLPHALMLTAIVVGVATVGVAFALLIRIHSGFQTLDEDVLRERMK